MRKIWELMKNGQRFLRFAVSAWNPTQISDLIFYVLTTTGAHSNEKNVQTFGLFSMVHLSFIVFCSPSTGSVKDFIPFEKRKCWSICSRVRTRMLALCSSLNLDIPLTNVLGMSFLSSWVSFKFGLSYNVLLIKWMPSC